MSFAARPEAPPLHEDAAGALRVGQSRVLLEIVIRAFEDGAAPETIVQQYPALALADVYAVIAYYLRHVDEVDKYLSGRELQAQIAGRRVQTQQGDLTAIRARLLAQRQAQG